MIGTFIQPLFKIEFQPNMSEQKRQRQKIYYVFNIETKAKKTPK